MSFYYYKHQDKLDPLDVPRVDPLEDSVFSTGTVHVAVPSSPPSRAFRPRSSTDSIPFVDADVSSGGGSQTRNSSFTCATSSSEEALDGRLYSSVGGPSWHARSPEGSVTYRCYPPPSPPASFLDSEDAPSLNNLLDALDGLDDDEDRTSYVATSCGSSKGDDVDEEDDDLLVDEKSPSRGVSSVRKPLFTSTPKAVLQSTTKRSHVPSGNFDKPSTSSLTRRTYVQVQQSRRNDHQERTTMPASSPVKGLPPPLVEVATFEREVTSPVFVEKRPGAKTGVSSSHSVSFILPPSLKMPRSEQDWISVARGFETKWPFLHCLGAMDGKHINMQSPINMSRITLDGPC